MWVFFKIGRIFRLLDASFLLVLLGLLCFGPMAHADTFQIAPGQSCLDAGCHAALVTKNIIHKPASKASSCKFCHKAATPEQHEFNLAGKKTEICVKCHKMVKEEKSQHLPAKRGMCLTCHDPHQSDNRYLLTKRPAGELCRGCHKKVGLEGESRHGPVENAQCTACHNPHASEEKKLLRDKQPDLCLKCHNRSLVSESGNSLPSTGAAFGNDALVKHKPFGTGRCSFCHEAHSSENHRLLKKPYPAEFYASFDKEAYFCFGCHKVSAFESPRTVEDTDFRNGNLNLHYRHVNREKGRTCRACHDHHAGKYPKLIRESVAFGQRNIQITEFSLTETGGTCSPACHLPVAYDRLNPVPIGIRMSPREGQDATHAELGTTLQTEPN